MQKVKTKKLFTAVAEKKTVSRVSRSLSSLLLSFITSSTSFFP